MNDNKKMGFFDSVKKIGIIGIGDIAGKGIASVFWIYIASVIAPEEFGEISYFIGIAGMVSVFSGIGTQNVITVFMAKKIDLVKTLTFISVIFSIIGSIALLVIFSRVDVGILAIGFVINNIVIGGLLGKKEFGLYSKYSILQKGLVAILGITTIYFFNYEGLIFAIAFSYLIFIHKLIYFVKNSNLKFELLRDKWKFVINNYIMIIFGSTGTHIDKIIIMPLLGAAVLGNYSLGIQVLVLFTALSSILYKFILPQDSTRRSTHKIKKYLFLTSIGISVLGFFSLPIIMVELFPEYNEATNAIQILSLDIVPTSLLVIFVSKFLSLEKSGIILISSGLGLVTMILGVFTLGVNYEMTGLFLTWVLSTTINVTILILYYKKLGYSFSQI
mgnify:FL=1